MHRLIGSLTVLAIVLVTFVIQTSNQGRFRAPETLFATLKAASLPPSDGQPVRFEGHQVWRVAIASLTDLARINTLQDQVPTLDFWTDPRIGRHGVDIRVSSTKGAQEALAAYLSKFSLSYDVFIPDVQHAIEKQLLPPVVAAPHLNSLGDHQSLLSADADPTKTYFTKYHPISEINEYLDYLVKEYPHLAEKFSLGKTYEGRDQWGMKLRAPRNEVSSIAKEKKEFVFFGGHHAREWIGPAVVQYILTSLITSYGKDPALTHILDSFDFTIIPVLNVDGYEYTHTTNRMWRKNRQPNAGNLCVGTDPNRNWASNWGGDGTTSKNPCSDSYIGTSPFSAPEPKNLANYVTSRNGAVISFIDFHAYSQLWMYPYGAFCDRTAPIHVESAAQRAASALKSVHGKTFAVGSICNIIYQASGSSVDFAYDTANVTFSYGVELRDQGLYGFLLPPKQIVPSGEETLAGVVELVGVIEKWLKEGGAGDL